MLDISLKITTHPCNISSRMQASWHQENMKHIQYIFSKYKYNNTLACFGDHITIRDY